MPSKKKKYNARFPPARIKKIMQTDEDVGKVAAPVPVIISRALELFIESLIVKTSETTQSRNAKTLTATHIKQTIHSEKNFDFLRDLVASVPDHQAEEDADVPNNNKKPRVPRQRKQKDSETGKRKRKKKNSSESSESQEDDDDEDDESTETDEEQESYSSHPPASVAVPNFSFPPPNAASLSGHSIPPTEPPMYNPAVVQQSTSLNSPGIPHSAHMAGYAMHLNNHFPMSQPMNLCTKDDGGRNSELSQHQPQTSGNILNKPTPVPFPPVPGITPVSTVPLANLSSLSSIMKAPSLASSSSVQEDDDYDT